MRRAVDGERISGEELLLEDVPVAVSPEPRGSEA